MGIYYSENIDGIKCIDKYTNNEVFMFLGKNCLLYAKQEHEKLMKENNNSNKYDYFIYKECTFTFQYPVETTKEWLKVKDVDDIFSKIT
jgi:hypothetical protein